MTVMITHVHTAKSLCQNQDIAVMLVLKQICYKNLKESCILHTVYTVKKKLIIWIIIKVQKSAILL